MKRKLTKAEIQEREDDLRRARKIRERLVKELDELERRKRAAS
ncbi:MAG TPA: hypothetical protein VFI37_15450 [Gaiellaceae bacterium]|nr:hypothetical protein [Gaiellaceae bacterium]